MSKTVAFVTAWLCTLSAGSIIGCLLQSASSGVRARAAAH
jgi:hypothetical protein